MFSSGVISVLLSVLPVREWLINAIPRNLKLGMAADIGLFLGFIALKNAGIVVDSYATLVALGDIVSFEPLACIAAFVVIVALSARKVTGAVVIGILGAAMVGWLSGEVAFNGFIAMPPSPAPA